ncbi:4-hydroxy-tetrahydrodipicolinate synthase [uncultured Clostridium sp.]|jgi:4-hydroxy-tetrahydrodipicolinate synthase|uniref:4-hydroxy-tetrahydrodipicolinate synthase n=1 Tax=uncultured Clostridium sp. TaxID=59620 RepID=UPI0025F4E154|nr:4-hydroxy-tetrahydrodipicolinate synthase [uncultured Clostridium sp.]
MLKGIITPMITILDKERRIDFEGNKKMIETLIKGGVNGILFMGSIGEFFAMRMEEKKEFISFAVKTVNKRVPVLIGTGGTSVDEVIELTKFAETEKADAAVIISPYYFKLDDETIYNYYSDIAKNTKLPIFIYNFPDRTAVNINPKVVLKLAGEFPNIVGIKDTVDGMSHTRELIGVVKGEIPDFAVFSGFDEYLMPNLLSGGNGLIAGLTNVFPKLFTDAYKAFTRGNFQEINKFQKKVNRLMSIYSVAPYFITTIKTIKALQGLDIVPMPKKPYGLLDNDSIEKLKKIIKN